MIEEGRVRTSPETFRRRFASEQPLRIAIEAGTHSPWASRVLEEECGHEVLVANARKLRLIYARASVRPTRSMPRTWLAWHGWTRSCSTHSNIEAKIPRLVWPSSARVKRW